MGFLALQTKTALSRMTRERETVSAQLTLSEQSKQVAEGEMLEVQCLLICCGSSSFQTARLATAQEHGTATTRSADARLQV